MKVTVTLQDLPFRWETGINIMGAKVSLGQQEKASSCEITIADPSHVQGAQLIQHTLDNGGIVALPDSNSNVPNGTQPPGSLATPANAAAWEQAIVNECLRQGVTDRNQIAYVLATAKHESGNFVYTEEIASGDAYEGRSDLGNNQLGDGRRFKGRGLVQVTGRANYQKWSERLGIDFIADPERMEEPAISLTTLVVGMRDGVYTGRGLSDYITGSSVDFRNARRIVNQLDLADKIAGYAQDYLSSGTVDRLLASGGAPSAISATAVPDATVGTTVPIASVPEPVIKGAKIQVEVSGFSKPFTFEYYHQGTDVSHDGTTVLRGQSIRWILNRRPRNRSIEGRSLKALAEEIAKSQGVTLKYEAPFDPKFEYLDQSGISDYQLLVREAENNGLVVSEEGTTLTIKGVDNIRDTALLLIPGNNLITWKIEDRAIDPNAESLGSSLQQEQPKVTLDPMTGQMGSTGVPEVDPTASLATTGQMVGNKAVVEPGQAAIATEQQGRMKRVKGLPSTFTIPLSEASLDLRPMDAVRTRLLPGSLSRIWMVDNVAHDFNSGTTTLKVFSPVEIPDVTPAASGVTAANVPPGSYIYPVTGFTVTSKRGMRNHPVTGERRMHHGVDFGCPTGTPVHAMSNGVVSFVGQQRGYGNLIKIKHPDGNETRYAHLDTFDVAVGQEVPGGAKIADSGNTGVGTAAHLHAEVRDSSGSSQDWAFVGLRTLEKGDTV